MQEGTTERTEGFHMTLLPVRGVGKGTKCNAGSNPVSLQIKEAK